MLLNYLEEKRRERNRKKRFEQAGRVTTGLAIGALIGGLGGVLFAPKPGKETRKEITDKAVEAGNTVKNKAYDLKEQTLELQEKVKSNVKNKLDKVKDKKEIIEEGAEEVEKDIEETASDLKR